MFLPRRRIRGSRLNPKVHTHKPSHMYARVTSAYKRHTHTLARMSGIFHSQMLRNFDVADWCGFCSVRWSSCCAWARKASGVSLCGCVWVCVSVCKCFRTRCTTNQQRIQFSRHHGEMSLRALNATKLVALWNHRTSYVLSYVSTDLSSRHPVNRQRHIVVCGTQRTAWQSFELISSKGLMDVTNRNLSICLLT